MRKAAPPSAGDGKLAAPLPGHCASALRPGSRRSGVSARALFGQRTIEALRAGSTGTTTRLLVAQVGLEGQAFADVAARLGLTRDASAKRWQRLRARVADLPQARALLAELA